MYELKKKRIRAERLRERTRKRIVERKFKIIRGKKYTSKIGRIGAKLLTSVSSDELC